MLTFGFFANRVLLDEVFASEASLTIYRDGESRYAVHIIDGASSIDLRLWTTRRYPLRVAWHDGPAPDWVEARFSSPEILESVSADQARIHFEHLDRNYYFLGLGYGGDHWLLHFAGAGYLKLAAATRPRALITKLHLPVALSWLTLREALAAALRAQPTRLVGGVPDGAPTPASGNIPVVLEHHAGDFGLSVSFPSCEQDAIVAVRLAGILGCAVLAGDLSGAQPTGVVATPEGDVGAAAIDPRSLRPSIA